jgi:hypothetical protein
MTDLGIELLVRVQRLFQLRHRLSDAIMEPTGGVPAWRPWRAGSRVAPRPLAVDQLEPLLAAGHLFPEHPLFGDLPVALGIQSPPERSPWEHLQKR